MEIWTATSVLHLGKPLQFTFTGSGNTTADYVQNLLSPIFALAAMLIKQRRRPSICLF